MGKCSMRNALFELIELRSLLVVDGVGVYQNTREIEHHQHSHSFKPFDLLHSAAQLDAGIGADPVPENPDGAFALVNDLPVQNTLRPVAHFRSGIQFPKHRDKHYAFFFVALVPVMNNRFGNLPLVLNIGGRGDEHFDDSHGSGGEIDRPFV